MLRLRRALLIMREELILFLSVVIVLIFLAAVGIYYFEKDSQPELLLSCHSSSVG